MAERQEIIPDDVKQTIRDTFFKDLKDDVVIEVFTLSGMNDQYNEAAAGLIRSLAALSPKIKASYHTVGDAQSIKRNVTRSPSVLIAPDKYRLRYTGAPLGEEGRSLLVAIMMASTGATILSEQAGKRLLELKEKRDIRIFVSPTCPYCPQQVLAAMSAAIIRPDLISAEAVEIYENQDLAEQLGSLAVPQTYINGKPTGQGLQPEPWFIESVLTLQEPQAAPPRVVGETLEKDLVIIGGGPAGLTAAIYAARAGLDSVVIEKANVGGQVAITPVVENYPGFMRIGGRSLVDMIAQQALQYADVNVGEHVTEVARDKDNGRFYLKTNYAIYIAKALIIATGADYRHLDAPGAEKYYGRGVSYCATCDGYFFKDGRTVVVVGGGNTAVTDALYLHNLGAKVTLVHRRDTLRAELRLQESLKQTDIPILWNSEVREIKGERLVRSVTIEDTRTGKRSEMNVDGVFIGIGYAPNNDVAKKIGLELTPDGYIKTDLVTMRTSASLVYAAGDVTGSPKQIVVAVAQGSVAAMTAFEEIQARFVKKEAAARKA
jgi:thioredoxin reductase (NADPH)